MPIAGQTFGGTHGRCRRDAEHNNQTNNQISDEMSEADFVRYQAEVERIAQRKGYGLVATDSPRRFVCSDSPEDIRSATGGQTSRADRSQSSPAIPTCGRTERNRRRHVSVQSEMRWRRLPSAIRHSFVPSEAAIRIASSARSMASSSSLATVWKAIPTFTVR